MTQAPHPPGSLRPYQAAAIGEVVARWRGGARGVMLQMPTGAGKTRTACEHATIALRSWGRSVMIVLHTRELRRQWVGALEAAGVAPGVIASGVAPDPYARCQVAQVQTLDARVRGGYGFWSQRCDLLIIDEAHHAAAASYLRCIEALEPAAMLGLSATPARADGKGLDPPFDALVRGPDVADLIEAGHLSDYVIRSAELNDFSRLRRARGGDYAAGPAGEAVGAQSADAVRSWQREAPTHQTIAFCCTRRHGREVAERFRRHGVATGYADGSMHVSRRDRAIADFAARRTRMLVSVDLLGEGVDIPGASCALLLRPTRSVPRHLQPIGRVIRPHDHPSGLSVVIDCVGNCRRLGGPRTPYEWTLDGGVERADGRDAEAKAAEAKAAEASGGGRPPPVERDVLLVDIDDATVRVRPLDGAPSGHNRRDVAHALRLCRSLGQMRELATRLGYRGGWAEMQWRMRRISERGRK